MSRDYIPSVEANLVTFATNYSTLVTANPTSLSLTAAQATALAAVVAAFVSAYNVVHNGSTRSPANIVLKDQAKVALVKMLRQLSGIIQKSPIVTDEQRTQLGLTVPAQRTPIPPPAVKPKLDIVAVDGRTVTCRAHAPEGSRRAFPPGCKSVFVFSYVGPTAPTDPALYQYQGSSSRTRFNIQFPDSVAAGSQVWICAAWANPRNETGPACEPVPTYLQFGPATAAG